MSKIYKDNCLQQLAEGAIPTADADISGNGVILAFILSAYISFIVVLIAYATGFVDAELLNAVDTKVFRVRPYRRKNPRVHKTICKAILALGDQQIVTGIAILGAGFQGLRTGKISVYHYQIVLYLAWMSSSVHLSALTILGAELARNPGLMVWRVTGMLVLLVLLIVALIPTISNDWGLMRWEGMLPDRSGWGIPARCFWGRLWGDGVNSDSVLGFVILGVSYIWKVGALFPVVGAWYKRWIRHPIENVATKVLRWSARRYQRHRTWYNLWLFRLLLTVTLPLFATLAMLASFAASLWLSALGLVFGTMQVVIPRNQNLWYTASQEESWSFGQLVPLILLVQPLGTVSEHVWPSSDEAEGEKHKNISHESRPSAEDDSDPNILAPIADLKSITLLQYLTTPPSPSTTPSSPFLPTLPEFLQSTHLFTLTSLLLNASIIATATLVYDVDAHSIGNDKVPKWELSAQCIGFCVLGIWVVVGVVGVWSRLGRVGKKGGGGRGDGGGVVLDGEGLPRHRSGSVVEMGHVKP